MYKTLTAIALAVAGIATANAAVIIRNDAGTNTLGGSGYEGHSFTMPVGTAYDHLTFSWISSNRTSLLAAGDLYILSQEYLGSPNGLSSTTPGFIAESTGIAGSAYVFNTGVRLDAGAQYWVYMDGAASLAGGGYTFGDPYPGGKAYEQFGSAGGNYFNNGATLDFNFQLSGTAAAAAVPEPATLALVGLGLIGAAASRRRRRAVAAV